MPVIVSQAQIQSVKDALASVRSNGQALAACNASIQASAQLASYLRSIGGAIRNQAASDLDAYAARVNAFRNSFTGTASAPVSNAVWSQAYTQIFNLYMLAFTLESTMPAGQDFGDNWGAALSYAIQLLPQTIGNAVRVAANAINDTAETIIWNFVKGAWPILLAAAGGLFVLVMVKKKVNEGIRRAVLGPAPRPPQG
jgi:hypothetical protein